MFGDTASVLLTSRMGSRPTLSKQTRELSARPSRIHITNGSQSLFSLCEIGQELLNRYWVRECLTRFGGQVRHIPRGKRMRRFSATRVLDPEHCKPFRHERKLFRKTHGRHNIFPAGKRRPL